MWFHLHWNRLGTDKTFTFRALVVFNVFLSRSSPSTPVSASSCLQCADRLFTCPSAARAVLSGFFVQITGTWAAVKAINKSYTTGAVSRCAQHASPCRTLVLSLTSALLARSPFSCLDNSGS